MAEARTPIGVAQYCNLRVLVFILEGKSSSNRGPHTQSGKEIPAYHVAEALLEIVPIPQSNFGGRERNKSH